MHSMEQFAEGSPKEVKDYIHRSVSSLFLFFSFFIFLFFSFYTIVRSVLTFCPFLEQTAGCGVCWCSQHSEEIGG